MATLVIVESPTKARTIRNYLPNSYQVEASMGHVRDLPSGAKEVPEKYKDKPWKNLAINVENNFEPIYVIPKTKEKVVKELKTALKKADELILATDEDREGESISWHLLEILKPKVPVKRMVFHEITQEAIQKALDDCREIDRDLVHAQETRRILDRLYGYTLSPLLWKKIGGNLSAGRVQSVAVRLIVGRERERRAFQSGSYWDLEAQLEHEKSEFSAKLITLDGKKLATGADFDPDTGRITEGRDVKLLNETEATTLKERLIDRTWTVSDRNEKAIKRRPSPPFTTSTLQQEANRKIGMSARETMSIAQKLYEQGYITYMRTDSVHLSQEAIAASRACIEQKYGKKYLSPQPRQYSTKSKGAQEAHEAIRPAGNTFRTPKETGLADKQFKLYDLIWKRTVACQMAEARLTQIAVNINVEEAVFRASGKRIDFDGFFRAYVEGSDDPDAAIDSQEILLPPLQVGDKPNCQKLEALGHETQPPARFTEASLVKTLEKEGVGRPSTYASIINTIISREYIQKRGKALVPTFTAFAVTSLLEEHFPDLVDLGFTSQMEQTLDDIAVGKAKWLPYLETFYRGETGLETQVQVQEDEIDLDTAKTIRLENIEAKVRIGKFGPYIEYQNGEAESIKASIPKDVTPGDLDSEQIANIIRQKIEGPDKLGLFPGTGEPIYLLNGPYGPYVQLGQKTDDNPAPRVASLPKKQKIEDVTLDMAVRFLSLKKLGIHSEKKEAVYLREGPYGHYFQLGEKSETNKRPKIASLPEHIKPEEATLDIALNYLSLPRLLGEHPETGGKIKASIGFYGPYVVHEFKPEGSKKTQKDYRSLKKDIDNVLEIDFERAMELLAQPKRARGGRKKKPLRELGIHPEDKEPVNLYKGPHGDYIKHNETNVGIPEGETIESITLEAAVALLAEKATSKKTKSTTRKKSTTKKKTTTRKKKTK
ncbi:DNA topoisomerase 1 [Hyella patelloides LEGE 07179]|uniref:DNA topoisomerase 1 n=1 Tax=Hyella patelloides LEGE 07179 TaxID=945734 RepID=A0A563VNX4_9CYAN|nr:type I DNA topoisomerase [Hyella patelloides]VEP13168.1 DNA topoisomerase 1 [Hyella patelloides LEGE 07179]